MWDVINVIDGKRFWVLCLIFLGLASQSWAQPLPRDPVLVGHWDFDESEGQWAVDASDFGNDGFLGSKMGEDADDPQWIAEGKEGGCLRFDGEGDRVVVQDAPALHPARGVIAEAWAMQTERTPYARVLDKGLTFDMYVHEDGWVSFRTHGAEAKGLHSAQPVPLNQWVKIRAELYAGQGRGGGERPLAGAGQMRLFIDDELVKERVYPDPIENSGHDLTIGATKLGRPFCGLIDEVKIWNVGYEPPPALQRLEPDEHTVGLWHLDGDAKDASAHHNDGELVSGEMVRGRLGQAVRFDGDGCVRVPDNPSLSVTSELTIDAWVNQHERGSYARIVEKSDWAWGLWIGRRGHADFFFKTADGGWHHNVSVTEIGLRRWVHIRAEFDGLEAVVYLDGHEDVRNEMGPGQDELMVSDADLYIGNRHLMDRGFVGMIDEVRISNRVRSERPPLAIKVSPFPSRGTWTVRANARGAEQTVARMTGTVRAAGGEEAVRPFTIDDLARGIGTTEVVMGQPAPGKYVVSLVAHGADGRPVAEAETEVSVVDARPWLEAKAGVTDKVLPPWTPLEVSEGERATVGCWGRRYELGGGGLPRSITSAAEELLAGEVALAFNRGAEAGRATWGAPQVAEKSDARVVLTGGGEAAGCALKMRTQIEFDGLVRCDLEVTPPDGGAELSELRLEIPLRAARATLMHHPMGRWFEDETCAGAVPEEGWQRDNTWYLWVGDEDRGLCWFAEDQTAWGLDAEKPGISLTSEGDRTVLRVWLINGPTKLDAPRTFTWGLMATPVKPMPADWRAWRFGSSRYDVNVAVQWSVKNLSKWHSFPVPHEPEAYVKLGDEAHAKGQRIVPYTNFNMQSNVGEAWEYFGAEWDAHAGRGTAADVLAMGVINMRCCPVTEDWADFITWQYKTFLEEYDWDGFYLDNSIPGRCNNAAHPDSHKNRVHIFGTRELMKRFYAVTKLNDPRNVMVCHMSSRLCIPLLSFCDAYVDGEQYSWALEDFEGGYLDLTSLARVRAELMGRQWGLIPLFLPEIKGGAARTPERTRELLALLLPHGTRFWIGACHRETLLAALDVVDEFGLVEAEFLPYWSNENVLKADAEDLIVSAYTREDKGALVIVSNLGDEDREASVRLELAALGLEGQPAVEGVLDGADVRLQGTTLEVSVPARDFRLILLGLR